MVSKKKRAIEVLDDESTFTKKAKTIKDESGENSEELQTTDNPKTTDISNFSQEDMAELINRIETSIPPHDTLRFTSRIEKLNWEEISFAPYSAQQCQEMWEAIQKKLRGFRLLREVIEDAKTWLEKPWTSYGSKKVRHPDLPKRPLSSYMLFYMKSKDKILKKSPKLDMPSLTKHIAEMFKNLPPDQKEYYSTEAAKLRKQYENEMQEFYRLHPDQVPATNKRKKRRPDEQSQLEGMPKKPSTPFKYFYEDRVKSNENIDKGMLLETCKEQWKLMCDERKLFWINWALEQEEKYKSEMETLIVERPELAVCTSASVKSVLTKDEKSLKERMSGKPEKPPNSAYSLFSRLMLNSGTIKNVTPKERLTLVSQQWKQCTPEMKKDYQEKVTHMIEQYKLEYANYLESLPEDKRREELTNSTPKRKPVKSAEEKSLQSEAATSKKIKIEDNENRIIATAPKPVFPDEPQQPPSNPYNLFVQKVTKTKSLTKVQIHKMWADLDAEEKNHYKSKLEKLKMKYVQNYEKFLKNLTQDQLREYSRLKAPVSQKSSSSSQSESESDDEENSNSSDSSSECSDNEDE